MSFRKSLLLSAAVFLSSLGVAVLAAPPGGHLNISQVLVNDPNDPTSITIVGTDFLFGPEAPTVTLGEYVDPLEIVGVPTNETIVALLPENIVAGDYLLTVTTGTGQSQNDEYDLTLGAVGPQGPAGQDGAPGVDGQDGAPGKDGQDGAPGADGSSCSATDLAGGALVSCTDGTTATVSDGAPGIPGAAGADGRNGENCYDGIVGGTSVEDCIGPPGPKGDKGDRGEPGPAGTLTNVYFLDGGGGIGWIAGVQVTSYVTCDPGDTLVSGGHVSDTLDAQVTTSGPVLVDRDSETRLSWKVDWQNGLTRGARIHTWVGCADTTPDSPARSLMQSVVCAFDDTGDPNDLAEVLYCNF